MIKYILSYALYYLGDLCCKLHLYTLYQKCMEWSVNLDVDCKVWNKNPFYERSKNEN